MYCGVLGEILEQKKDIVLGSANTVCSLVNIISNVPVLVA